MLHAVHVPRVWQDSSCQAVASANHKAISGIPIDSRAVRGSWASHSSRCLSSCSLRGGEGTLGEVSRDRIQQLSHSVEVRRSRVDRSRRISRATSRSSVRFAYASQLSSALLKNGLSSAGCDEIGVRHQAKCYGNLSSKAE